MELTLEQLKYLKNSLIEKYNEHEKRNEFEDVRMCKNLIIATEKLIIGKTEEEVTLSDKV